jgi:hypothetical protein
MRRLAFGLAAALLALGACSGGPDENADPSASPSSEGTASEEGTESAAPALDLAALCESFAAQPVLPNWDAADYGHETNTLTPESTVLECSIEPRGEYYDVAAAVGTFGRSDSTVTLNAGQSDQTTPEYDVAADPQEYIANNFDEPVTEENAPCRDSGGCADGRTGHHYSFEFEALSSEVLVQSTIDFVTTDISGEQQEEFQVLATDAFGAYMGALATQAN